MRVKRLNQKGFSLIELMIVVGIIGVLATMAVPKFSAFQAKAKQTEAKTTLNHIYTLQEAYFIDFNIYAVSGATYDAAQDYGTNLGSMTVADASCATTPAWANSIGLTLTPCTGVKPIYSYSSFGTAADYTADARTGTGANNKLFPGCPSMDQWQLGKDHNLGNPSNGLALCNNQ